MKLIPIPMAPSRFAATVLAATGVVVLAAGCSSATDPGAPAASSTSAPAPSAKSGRHAAKGTAGRITAEQGSTWTMVTAEGTQLTVDITPQTTFGTTKHPATAQQFTVGTAIRVAGQTNGSTITATRIGAARAAGSTPAPASPSPSSSAPPAQ